MKLRGHIVLSTALLGFVIFLSGCATPANRAAMTASSSSYGKQFEESIAVHVSGGQKTNPAWTSEVSNEEFKAALAASIKKSGLFSQVFDTDTGDYRLDVQLVELKQPMIGLNFKVVARTHWRLRESTDSAPIWREDITAEYTAKVGDSLYAVHRLRLANEGAIRVTIENGLTKLAELDL